MFEGRDNVGAVLSILIVIETESKTPALFVAEQVKVVLAVSEVRFDAVHPFKERISDSASIADQLTVTSLVYQPLDPIVPLTLGVITGGVLSVMDVTL